MMLSFVFAMAVLPVKGLETRRAREKTGIDTRRLPLQPSGNHRLEKGDPPSPLIRDARAQARFDVCRKSEFIAVFQEQCRNRVGKKPPRHPRPQRLDSISAPTFYNARESQVDKRNLVEEEVIGAMSNKVDALGSKKKFLCGNADMKGFFTS